MWGFFVIMGSFGSLIWGHVHQIIATKKHIHSGNAGSWGPARLVQAPVLWEEVAVVCVDIWGKKISRCWLSSYKTNLTVLVTGTVRAPWVFREDANLTWKLEGSWWDKIKNKLQSFSSEWSICNRILKRVPKGLWRIGKDYRSYSTLGGLRYWWK